MKILVRTYDTLGGDGPFRNALIEFDLPTIERYLRLMEKAKGLNDEDTLGPVHMDIVDPHPRWGTPVGLEDEDLLQELIEKSWTEEYIEVPDAMTLKDGDDLTAHLQIGDDGFFWIAYEDGYHVETSFLWRPSVEAIREKLAKECSV